MGLKIMVEKIVKVETKKIKKRVGDLVVAEVFEIKKKELEEKNGSKK